MTEPPLQVVTFGETMVRLSPPTGYSLENTPTLEVFAGGTESNMAIAFARLGGRVGWVSRLPRNGLGRRIAGEIAHHGVDVSRVVWCDGERAGLFFIETAPAPAGNRVLYDRAHAAIANLEPDELDWDYLTSAEVLFLTGITPALGPGCREAWRRAAREAKGQGRRVVLDINYRALLWTPEAAREAIEEILEHTGAVIAAHRDLRTLFGAPDDPAAAAREFAEAHGVPLVVLTLGDQGSLAFDGNLLRQPAFPSEPLDRIGAGDAFAAGFLHGWLAGDLARGLVLGNASAALKQTYRGDTTWATREDVLELVEIGAADSRQVRR